MTLIRKPKEPSFTEQEEPMLVADPLLHMEHICQEATDELDREAAFRKALDATLRETEEEHRQIEKRRAAKGEFWLSQLMKRGEKLDWDQLVARMRKRDPASAKFLARLLTRARAWED
jgi:hypothetical protein